MQFPDARILIFAKAPEAGRVKTRLIPALDAQQAAEFHAKCVRYAVSRRCGEEVAPVVLYAAPNAEADFFQQLARQQCVALVGQEGDDLGERMHNASAAQLQAAQAVLLTGTDAPALREEHLREALSMLLKGADVVMQAAEDGGYVMLGLKRTQPGLFSSMPWGSDQVAEMTRLRCREQGLRMRELPLSWDVDRPEDLLRLDELDGFNTFRG